MATPNPGGGGGRGDGGGIEQGCAGVGGGGCGGVAGLGDLGLDDSEFCGSSNPPARTSLFPAAALAAAKVWKARPTDNHCWTSSLGGVKSGDHAPEDVPEAFGTTLKDLQIDYIDLFLIHGPIRIKKGTTMAPENFLPPDIPATWGAMEKLYDSGKARAIAVSNFSCKKLEGLLAVARVPPAVNQVECHLIWQQDKLRKLCQSRGVHLSAFSPLGSPGSPGVHGANLLANPIVISVAEKLEKTPAQVALRWGLQMGQSVLPKSANEARIKENLDIFHWSIPEDLMAKFSEIKQVRLLKAEFAVHPLSVYKTLEDLWEDGEV